MRRFEHLGHLLLQQVSFLSAHDLRRTFECLRNLKHLVFFCPQWLYSKVDHPPCRRPRPHSRIRLETLSLEAQAGWITDTRSIDFLDWLSASGAISNIRELRLWGLTLIDDGIIAAVSRMLCATQQSARLDTVDTILGPDVDWTPLHASLASLPRLNHLHLACPYDAASLSQLTDTRTMWSHPPNAGTGSTAPCGVSESNGCLLIVESVSVPWAKLLSGEIGMMLRGAVNGLRW
ncbi:hypothetical protein PHLGIDRAFT_164108 [Phlebiopsis gigantea 11061_1 CR5-6]|uniref:F-box domain-containing protein n=1 Tax=Phlebiopsis gigantea (strain 11061_1 CR5-6) TaxID=745531 RepID=A0A0C3RVB8_PHLG1|nr:hypothetical protein PHLGIDRAFT_164108 [Phlebiopsis gigantea 11061_1 CR5-6]